MANDSAIREPMIDAVLVKNANRMMTVASLLKHGIELSFADGAKGLIPYSDLPPFKRFQRNPELEGRRVSPPFLDHRSAPP